MADVTSVFAEKLAHANSSEETTSGTFTPALGDVAFVILENASDLFGLTLTGGGMTWSKPTAAITVASDVYMFFRATSGTPSDGALTVGSEFDPFSGYMIRVLRPSSDITYTGESGRNSSSGSGGALTVSITDIGTVALQLGLGGSFEGMTYTTDSGWTGIADTASTDTNTSTTQYRASADTEWIVNLSGSNPPAAGFVLEYAAVATGKGPLINGGLINNGLINGGLIHG